MKTLLLAILAIACMGLALYYVSFETSEPAAKGREEKLFALDRKDITGIEIQGGALIRLVSKGQTWWVQGQVNFPADQEEVGKLIGNLMALPVRGTTQGPREEFGLDKPAMAVSLRTSRGVSRLFLGSDSPTSSFCYASLEGRKDILLLPANAKAMFRKSLFSLTDKYLVHVNPWDVSRVRVVKHGSILEFARDSEGAWRLAGADGRKLGGERTSEFFRNICRIKALSFPENQGTPDNPDVIVELSSSRGVQTLKLWKAGQKAYALSDYQRGRAEISLPLMAAIPSAPDDLLDRSIVAIQWSSVRKIVLKGKGERVFLMQGGKWYDGRKRAGDGEAIEDLVRTLNAIEYEDEYLLVPKDAGAGFSLKVYTDRTAAAFDITLYSQYYVAVGNKVFRINEGGMIHVKKSLNTLLGGYQ